MKKMIHDAETNEIVILDYNEIDIMQSQKDKELIENQKAEIIAKESARAALLDKLGITADEAKLLLG